MILSSLWYTIIYILISLIFAIVFFVFIPKRFQKKNIYLIVLFVLNLTLGPIFSILSLILVSALISQKPVIDFETLKSYVRDWELEKRPVGEKALANNNIPSPALYAILNTKDIRFAKNLKSVLSSKHDENRLLAFGYLEQVEKAYFSMLSNLETLYEKNQDLSILKKIAIVIWEMILFGVVDEDLRHLYEKKLKDILLNLSEKLEDDTVFHILGRTYLREGRYKEASRLLLKAFRLTKDKSKIMPYLLESLFYQRRFNDIKTYCEEYKKDKSFSVNLVSNNIINFWCN